MKNKNFIILVLVYCILVLNGVFAKDNIFYLNYKSYRFKIVVKDNQYQEHLVKKLLLNALDYVPSKWIENIKIFTFTKKSEQKKYLLPSNTVACYLHSNQQIVLFFNLDELTPDEFIKIVIHEFAHTVEPVYCNWPVDAFSDFFNFIIHKHYNDKDFSFTSNFLGEQWALLAESVLISPIEAKMKKNKEFKLVKRIVKFTSPQFGIIKNYQKINSKKQKRLQKIFKEYPTGTILFHKGYVEQIRLNNGKRISLCQKVFYPPEGKAIDGLLENLNFNNKKIVEREVLNKTGWFPMAGDCVFVYKNKLILLYPLSKERMRLLKNIK